MEQRETQGRGSEGIIGIFFFHYLGLELGKGNTNQELYWQEKRNLLILNWLFHCGKIRGKLRLFLRGYPLASRPCLGWLCLSPVRAGL